MMVENVPARVATPTSLTPATVASIGRSGISCRWRNTLSVITTALSTSMPIASSMPIMVRMLSVKPRKYIAPSVTSSDAGTASDTISVVGRWRRNSSSMKKLSTAPTSPALRSSRSDWRMLSAWLPTTRISTPCSCGAWRASSIASITRSATSTTLACVDLNTSMPTAGRPSMRRPTPRSGATSSICATSASRTPLRTSRLRTSATERNSPTGRTVKRWSFSVIWPALTEKLLRSSRLAQLLHVDAVGREPVRLDQHAQLARLDALQLDPRDAVEPLDRPLQELLQRVVLVGEVLLGGDADHRDRLVRRAEREHQDAVGRRGQLRADRVDLGAHLEGRGLGVAVPAELHRELRLVGAGGGADLLDAGQRGERLLDRAHHQLLHLLGRRAGVGDDDPHARETDVGHGLEPQQPGGDQADRQHGQRDHDGRHRALQGELRVAHRVFLSRRPAPRPARPPRHVADRSCGRAPRTPPG